MRPTFFGTLQIVTAAPEARSSRFNAPSAKNPIDLLSGDKNTDTAPSVPGTSVASTEISGRTQMRSAPVGSAATKARRDPSGDGENGTVSNGGANDSFGGGRICSSVRTGRATPLGRCHHSATATTIAAAATVQAR